MIAGTVRIYRSSLSIRCRASRISLESEASCFQVKLICDRLLKEQEKQLRVEGELALTKKLEGNFTLHINERANQSGCCLRAARFVCPTLEGATNDEFVPGIGAEL